MSVLVYLEHAGGVMDEPSLQAAALARSLADASGTTVAAILASDAASQGVEDAPAVDALHVAVHEAYASWKAGYIDCAVPELTEWILAAMGET